MLLRRATTSDLPDILQLFRDTVHSICARDYSQDQLNAWAPENLDKEKWRGLIENNIFYVAEIEGGIVGFGDLTPDGVINLLYVHRDHQGKGIASAILSTLEAEAKILGLHILTTKASVTAKPFFEHLGYRVVREQEKQLGTASLSNYVMEKHIPVP